jgi:hypothetical protein
VPHYKEKSQNRKELIRIPFSPKVARARETQHNPKVYQHNPEVYEEATHISITKRAFAVSYHHSDVAAADGKCFGN